MINQQAGALYWLLAMIPTPRIVDHAVAHREWVEPLRVLYDHQLLLISEGSGVVEIAGVTYQCTSWSYLIIPPAQPEMSHTLTAPWQRHWVHFDWTTHQGEDELPVSCPNYEMMDATLIHHPPAGVPSEVLRGPITDSERAFDLFTRLEHRWQHGSGHDRLTCRALLLELLLELLDTSDRTVVAQRPAIHLASLVRETLEVTSMRPMREQPPLHELLTIGGTSYAHAERVFHATYAMAPLQYLTALRIERAKHLLRTTACSVKEVAQRVGYDDAGYFTRTFARRTGMTPGAFARQTLHPDERGRESP